MTFPELLKVCGKLGGVGVTVVFLMWWYMHSRGYSDQAAWEVSLVSVAIATIANVIPSPLGKTNLSEPPKE